ncbi:MAG TPA: lipid A deacylase LpxR family protein [Bacteroidia bacterium]|jgi:hypothetical protein|nr:lipid A deacylase LpxR family protein [Bacteroidia bacterium]
MLNRLIAVILFLPVFVHAQQTDAADTTESVVHADSIPLRKAFIIDYDNDLFTFTDYYYTQGSYIELDFPVLSKDPLSHALLHTHGGKDLAFGITYGQQGFTPTSIRSDTVLHGDRPFSGTFYFGLNRSSFDVQKQLFVKSEFDLGVIGPYALGYESQKFIHEHTNNPPPHGWQNQIANDVMVNYSLIAEKDLLHWRPYDVWKVRHDHFDLVGYGSLNAGTVYTNGGFGLLTRAGILNDDRNMQEAPVHFQCFFFAKGEMKIIAYDATLEGGLFNTSSVYTIRKEDISRGVFSVSGGIGIADKKFSVEFYELFLSPEFEGGRNHGWGHIKLAFVL